MPPPPEAAGTIYDIGYRHYDGPRLGRRGAIGAIVAAGLRAVFGLGRSGKSKILPWGAVILGLIPAVVAVAEACGALGLAGAGDAAALARDKRMMRHTWQRHGLPQPEFRPVTTRADLHEAVAALPGSQAPSSASMTLR